MNNGIIYMSVIWFFTFMPYFGWSWGIESDTELLCHGVMLIIVSMGLVKR